MDTQSHRHHPSNMTAKMYSRSRLVTVMVLICLWVILALTACGDNETSGDTASADNVEIGKTIGTDEWEINVTAPTEKTQIVGEGQIVYRSEGTFVIVLVEAKNLAQILQIVPRDLFILVDSQGQEYEPTKSAIQLAYGLPLGLTILLDAPMKAGETRKSLLIYDVPTDASGLHLTIKGIEDTIALGF